MASAPHRRPLVLGTASKFRIALFRTHFTHDFTTTAADIDEKALTAGYKDRSRADPHTLTLALAHAKADAILASIAPHTDTILITSDQVVTHEGRIREKPESESVCREYLRSYGREPVKTVTGLVVTDVKSGKRFEGCDVASLAFRDIPEEIIDKLIEKGDAMYCAGGITVEDSLLEPYRRELKGEMESIQGLPITLLRQLLAKAGI